MTRKEVEQWYFAKAEITVDKEYNDAKLSHADVIEWLVELSQNLKQFNVMRSLPSLPSDKDINEKAKTHQQQFPNNSPMRSYKTGYHHALHDIEKAMQS